MNGVPRDGQRERRRLSHVARGDKRPGLAAALETGPESGSGPVRLTHLRPWRATPETGPRRSNCAFCPSRHHRGRSRAPVGCGLGCRILLVAVSAPIWRRQTGPASRGNARAVRPSPRPHGAAPEGDAVALGLSGVLTVSVSQKPGSTP